MSTPIDIELSSSDGFCTQRYEDLRASILDLEGSAIEAWGLNVLLRYGMARWIRTWDESVGREPYELPTHSGGDPLVVPGTWEAEVTILLSNMAFDQLQDKMV